MGRAPPPVQMCLIPGGSVDAIPGWDVHRRQPIDASLLHRCFSFFLSKSNEKNVLRWGLQKKSFTNQRIERMWRGYCLSTRGTVTAQGTTTGSHCRITQTGAVLGGFFSAETVCSEWKLPASHLLPLLFFLINKFLYLLPLPLDCLCLHVVPHCQACVPLVFLKQQNLVVIVRIPWPQVSRRAAESWRGGEWFCVCVVGFK